MKDRVPVRLGGASRSAKAAWLRFLGGLAVGAALLHPEGAGAAVRFRYEDLVRRLTDLEPLVRIPEEGEQCRQASSYDRASRYDAAAGRYLAWDANGDGDGFVRKEGNRIVMAEIEGPGCLWRMWSAAPKEGRVRIYLDGAEEPAVDLPFAGYFEGRQAPFNRPALVHSVALGWNNYTPIPFQRSCRIVADPGWGQYYQFVYSTFPRGTEVPTFRRELTASENAALDEANRRLSRGGSLLDTGADYGKPGSVLGGESRSTPASWTLGPGQVGRLELMGPAAVTAVRVRLPGLPEGAEGRRVLRELALSFRWDGESQPSVWAPVGDFFGTAAGANRYRSLPAGLTEDGTWYAHWIMPFANQASFEVANDGAAPRRVEVELVQSDLQTEASGLLRFHAKWHRDVAPPAEPGRRAIDWTLLKVSGRGRYAGVLLHVWNPRGGWWGEGDEKFHVDGEPFPSTFGTGSEDYFGYAWCNPTLFEHAYHSQTISMNNRGHIAVNRWHIPDNVPFQTSFDGMIEKYFPNSRPTLYAATVYWYQEAGVRDPYPPVAVAERTSYWDETMIQTRRVPGALEGEALAVRTRTGGVTQVQDMAGFGGDWSGDGQLWWTGARPGDRLVLGIPVAAAGRYRIKAQFTRAIDYGIVQIRVDGRALGGELDLFHDGVEASGPVDLGEVSLGAGERELEVRIVGRNPRAVPAHMFALDYLLLEPAGRGSD